MSCIGQCVKMEILKSSMGNNVLYPFVSLSTKNFLWFMGIFHTLENLTVCKMTSRKKSWIIPLWSISVQAKPVKSWIGFVPLTLLEKTSDQELRNAVYSGSWVTDAKRYFSKSGCPAHGLASNYMTGSALRQEYLETAIEWLSKGNIEVYMLNHQNDPNANELWLYFQQVINWIKAVFPNYRREMKGLVLGELFNVHKNKTWDANQLETEINHLMQEDDATRKGFIPMSLPVRKSTQYPRLYPKSKTSIIWKTTGHLPCL